MVNRLLLVSALLLASASVALAEPSVRVSVERSTVQVNQPFRIQVTVSGGKSEAPAFPKVDGLSVGPPSETMSNFSFVNGVVTQSIGVLFTATATRVGKVTIPAITVQVDGKPVTSRPIELTVAEGRAAMPPPPTAQRDSDPSTAAPATADPNAAPTEDDAVLITAEVDRRSVYEGEGIQLTLSRWVLRGVNAAPIP